MELQVSACDLADVYKVTTLALPGTFAVWKRDTLLADVSGIKRHRLNDAGLLEKIAELPLDWRPSNVSLANESLLASDALHVLSVSLSSFPASSLQWETDRALDLKTLLIAPNGDLLAPAGDNGVDRFAR
jgi:hypothetical protein